MQTWAEIKFRFSYIYYIVELLPIFLQKKALILGQNFYIT